MDNVRPYDLVDFSQSIRISLSRLENNKTHLQEKRLNHRFWRRNKPEKTFQVYILILIIDIHLYFRIATIASALYSMNRDFGIEFYSDSYNQDLRLNLPIETCLLQFIQVWIII